jgi:AmmeMemoRadiSam system protein B
MIRKAAVAGGFYSRSRDLLLSELKRSFELGFGVLPEPGGDTRPAGAIVPHAGYTYSGSVASYSYGKLRQIKKPEVAIIVGPNHTGYGSNVSIWPSGEWETPLGSLKVDEQLAGKLLSDFSESDLLSHRFEHSIEVQLPFIQYVWGPTVRIVPVCVLDQDLPTMKKLGAAIAGICTGHNVVLLASSDFSHYESHDVVSSIDAVVLEAILRMDVNEMYEAADKQGVSACGLGPIASVITAMSTIGPSKAELLRYATSGDATGDFTSVVGYASVVFELNRTD